MNIEQFVEQSTGEWRSMRSGHSLAFQQFEEVLSIVEINALDVGEAKVSNFITSQGIDTTKVTSPFAMR